MHIMLPVALAFALSAQSADASAKTPSESPKVDTPETPSEADAPSGAKSNPDPASAAPAPADDAAKDGADADGAGSDTEKSAAPADKPRGGEVAFFVQSRPPATVFLDDKKVGPTPLLLDKELAPSLGQHTVRLVREDGQGARSFTVELTGGTQRLIVDFLANTHETTGGLKAEPVQDAGVEVDPGSVPGAPPVIPVPPFAPDAEESFCPGDKPCMEAHGLAVWPALRLRTGVELQQPDPNVVFIGNNDGFFVHQARVGLAGAWRSMFGWRMVLDAIEFFPGRKPNDPVRPALTGLVDAYLDFTPSQFFEVRVGQAFAPGDYEGTTSRSELIFSERSVAVAGVQPGRGFEVVGLGARREVGIIAGARDARLGPVRLQYLFALTNGNGRNVLGNDNKLPAGQARFAVGYEDYVMLGFGGAYNPRTTGTVPNLYSETDATAFADLHARVFGVDFLLQGIGRQTTFDSLYPATGDPNAAAYGFGVTSWLYIDKPFGLPLFGFKPGYRISYYDPTSAFPDDQLLEHTIGIRYDPETYDLPMGVMLDFTSLWEIDQNGLGPLDNNRVVLMFQFDI